MAKGESGNMNFLMQLILTALAGGMQGAAAGWAAPEGQRLRSFSGIPQEPGMPSVDPATLLATNILALQRVADVVKGEAKAPVRLRSAVVPPLPVFTGGGLPGPIGLFARDPALTDPSILTDAGVNFGEGSLFESLPNLTPDGDFDDDFDDDGRDQGRDNRFRGLTSREAYEKLMRERWPNSPVGDQTGGRPYPFLKSDPEMDSFLTGLRTAGFRI